MKLLPPIFFLACFIGTYWIGTVKYKSAYHKGFQDGVCFTLKMERPDLDRAGELKDICKDGAQ